MANTQSANSWYVDSVYATAADDLAANVQVTAVLLTATSANARIVLSDPTTGNALLDLRLSTAGETRLFDLARGPISFRNGIRVATLTNAVATLIGILGD